MTQINERKGDLFTLAPVNGVLVHAYNTRGSWGAGIAKRFKELYPAAFEVYRAHCAENSSLLYSTLLIPPQPSDSTQHWIACLYTSEDYGKRRGTPESVLAATKTAIDDLKAQLESKEMINDGLGDVWACKFNSVSFGVPWGKSRDVVQEAGLDMTVVDREFT